MTDPTGNLRGPTIAAGASEVNYSLITTANITPDETIDETATVTIQDQTRTETDAVDSPHGRTVTILNDD